MFDYAIVTTARWETDSIVEWLLYHRSIGFGHVYVYCNDDEPLALYEVLLPFTDGPAPFVTFVHFGLLGLQRQMLLHCLRTYRHETRWLAFLDVDEFLLLRDAGDIRTFMTTMPPDTDCVYFNWIFFGTSGFVTRPNGSTLQQYKRRQAVVHPLTKVLLRTALVTDAWLATNPIHNFWHEIGDTLGPIAIYNVLGEPCNSYYHGFPEAAQQSLSGPRGPAILGRAVVHHYTLKSEADFKRRVERGTKGEFPNQIIWTQVVERGEAQAFLDATNEVEDTTLAEYWQRHLARGWQRSLIAAPPGPNLALNRPALQSSVSEWSHGDAATDATRVTNGTISSRPQCHTAHEDAPWWQVDLGGTLPVMEVRIFNRLDSGQDRLSRFALSVSQDGVQWRVVQRKDDNRIVGGADGNPHIWRTAPPDPARFVRITLLGRNFLTLDQVEVYGPN